MYAVTAQCEPEWLFSAAPNRFCGKGERLGYLVLLAFFVNEAEGNLFASISMYIQIEQAVQMLCHATAFVSAECANGIVAVACRRIVDVKCGNEACYVGMGMDVHVPRRIGRRFGNRSLVTARPACGRGKRIPME